MSFLKDFLFLDLRNYDNIGIWLPIGAIITLLCAAMILSAFYIHFYHSYASAICSRLIRFGAKSEETACTLKQLKLHDSHGVKWVLRGGGELAFTVKRVGDVKPTYEEYVEQVKNKKYKKEKIDFETARFFINPDEVKRANRIVSDNHSVIVPILLSAAAVCVYFLAALFLPDLLSYV